MWLNIELIERFYSTDLGKEFTDNIRKKLSKYLVPGKKVLSIGHNRIEGVTTIIPAKQGLMKGTISAHENMLPIANNYADVVLIIHILEYVNDLKKLLAEVYRIMNQYGTAIFIVPNLYANIVPCDEIFKYGKLELFYRYIIKKNQFIINNISHLSPYKHPLPVLGVGMVSVFETQKKITAVIDNNNGIVANARA